MGLRVATKSVLLRISFAVAAFCLVLAGVAAAEDDALNAALFEARKWVDADRFDRAIEILTPLASSEDARGRPEYALVVEFLGEAHCRGQDWVSAEKELKESIPLLEESSRTDSGKAFVYLTAMSVGLHTIGVMASNSTRWKESADCHSKAMLLPYTATVWPGSPWRAARAYLELGDFSSACAYGKVALAILAGRDVYFEDTLAILRQASRRQGVGKADPFGLFTGDAGGNGSYFTTAPCYQTGAADRELISSRKTLLLKGCPVLLRVTNIDPGPGSSQWLRYPAPRVKQIIAFSEFLMGDMVAACQRMKDAFDSSVLDSPQRRDLALYVAGLAIYGSGDYYEAFRVLDRLKEETSVLTGAGARPAQSEGVSKGVPNQKGGI